MCWCSIDWNYFYICREVNQQNVPKSRLSSSPHHWTSLRGLEIGWCCIWFARISTLYLLMISSNSYTKMPVHKILETTQILFHWNLNPRKNPQLSKSWDGRFPPTMTYGNIHRLKSDRNITYFFTFCKDMLEHDYQTLKMLSFLERNLRFLPIITSLKPHLTVLGN